MKNERIELVIFRLLQTKLKNKEDELDRLPPNSKAAKTAEIECNVLREVIELAKEISSGK